MAENTGIQWTDASWNCITGCERVSPGCAHCYAEQLTATRLASQPKYEGLAVVTKSGEPHWTGRIRLHHDELTTPLRWKKPRMIFVNSMSDTFHRDVPYQFLVRLFDMMHQCPQHTFQVLTKRAERMRQVMHDYTCCAPSNLPKNLWLGVSVEDQQRADERIPHLLQTQAAVRFLSCEPLLGQIDLSKWLFSGLWVIVGGESGPGARVCQLDWIRLIVSQCRSAGTPVFVKQLGKRPVGEWGDDPPTYCLSSYRHGIRQNTTELSKHKNGVWNLRDKKGGSIDEFPAELRVREFPKVGV